MVHTDHLYQNTCDLVRLLSDRRQNDAAWQQRVTDVVQKIVDIAASRGITATTPHHAPNVGPSMVPPLPPSFDPDDPEWQRLKPIVANIAKGCVGLGATDIRRAALVLAARMNVLDGLSQIQQIYRMGRELATAALVADVIPIRVVTR